MTSDPGELSVYLPGGVVLPPNLYAALREDRLVVFVGAGASVDAPSCLPRFKDLTSEILVAAGRSDPPSEDGRYEVQLGTLEDGGFDVHNAVRHILDKPGSAPNRWHKAIAQLFSSPERARIITTNYDTHLEEALGGGVKVWSAPGLPLGGSFTGVVHLHGCVDGPDEGLVVTDRDFGRAYMTEGWAREFLLAAFKTFYVLFLGYSHDDFIMHYFARGLDPSLGTNRFTLVSPTDDVVKWKRYGISTVTWEHDAHDPYGPGVDALRGWSQQIRWSALEHTQRIEQLVEGGPELNEVDDNYLTRALNDPTFTRTFARKASGESWLQWASDKATFQRLFDSDAHLTRAQTVLAEWFARTYVITGIGNPLSLLATQGGRLSAGLWGAIAHALWRPGPQGPGILEPWIAVLCQQDRGYNPTVLNYLLNDCRLPDDVSPLKLLLRRLFEPELRIKPGISFPGHPPSFSADIFVQADSYWLGQAMNNVIVPNIGDVAQDVYEIATSALTRYFELHTALGQVYGGHDPISRMRHAIEPHQQNRYGDDATLAVDLAREAASALASSRGALAIASDLLTRDVPILGRIAAWIVADA